MRDDGVDGTIAQLMGSAVGRRWLLKAGFGAGAAAVVVPRWAGAAGPNPFAGLIAGVGVVESRTFHFALGAAAHVEDLTLHMNGQEVPLSPHTPLTRMRLLGQGSLWRKLRRGRLTHYAEVEVPAERGLLASVRGMRDGQDVVVAQTFHAPVAGMREVAEAAFELEGSYRLVAGSLERLTGLGLQPSQITSADEVVALDSVVDSHQTAIALTMLHPNVATIGSIEVPTTKSLLGQTPEVTTLGNQIDQMHQAGEDYASVAPVVDADGNPSQVTIRDEVVTLTTVKLNTTDTTFTTTARSAFVAGIHGVRDRGDLGKVINRPLDELHDTGDTATWHQAEGVVPAPTPYVPPAGEQATVRAHVKSPYPTLLYGTYTQVFGGLSDRQLPLKLYNNYVRWVSVYVQYLKADGTNLSLDPNATFPNTRHAKSLGLLPQIWTILGVPIWDTNTIDVTLDYPLEASTARLLFCGLGDNAIGGGWRQYFPPDAYPSGAIAPTDEVLMASLLTGVLTIGVTAFALLVDMDVANSWAGIKAAMANPDLLDAALKQLIGSRILTVIESLAVAVATGAATALDIQNNGGSADNIWSILVNFGSIIPKVLFGAFGNPVWAPIALALLVGVANSKIKLALPLVGQVLAVLAAVGDVLTLGEAIGETIASPWVIENEVSLQYAATVTVRPDPNSGTPPAWPATARSWRIEAKIDGAAALSPPQTGTLNAGGGTDTTPIVLQLTAPFGGNAITWSIVVLDATGHQVATGMSPPLPNNDSDNPPATVDFQVKELPATITPATVFRRADTTVFNPTLPGYTWSRDVVDSATAPSGGIQEITGVTVSTRLGVAGLVWKANDRFWLRGVPVAETGTTISLGSATRQGFARRPFLLFDAFVGAADVGNHVLLEPDDTEDGYNVRALTIDPTTHELSWDPATSLGTFVLPVDAAALHSSGRVVTVHTATGRLAHVLPAATPQPPLATYAAGPGTEIGLLSAPTAIAVTNPGILLVLEAGASQLAAFDLNGNPARYFGTTPPANFTLPLPADVTWLDLAVDGAANIYLLSQQGDGSQVSDYRIDVYSPSGTPIATNSPGTNIPHLAVDYWRSIFAANYSALLNTTTNQPHIDPTLNVPEPSLSRFDPT
jgi:hypothetical protein